MTLRNILAAGFLFFLVNAQAQDFDWMRQVGGQSSTTRANKTAIDPSGNVFTVGTFSGTIDLDPGSAQYLINSNTREVYLSKLDSSGNFLWGKRLFDGNGAEIVADKDGNVLLLAGYYGTMDLDPGPASYTVDCGFRGLFILKLDAIGNFVWAKGVEGYAYTSINANLLALDSDDNIYFAGNFSGGPVDFDPGVPTYSFSSWGSERSMIQVPVNSFYFCKLDPAGNFLHANYKEAATASSSWLSTDGELLIACSDKYITGTYLEKYDPSGTIVWRQKWSPGFYISNMVTDNDKTIHVIGSCSAQFTDVDPGPAIHYFEKDAGAPAYFHLQLSNEGLFNHMGKIAADSGTFLSLNHLLTDKAGNIYTAGTLKGTADLDPETTVEQISSPTGIQFIYRLNKTGTLNWIKQLGSSSITMNDMDLDNFGNIYTTGSFKGTSDFDPSEAVYNANPLGVEDAFVLKLSGELITGVGKQKLLPQIIVFPNPCNALVHLQGLETSGAVLWRMYDPDGKTLATKTAEAGDEIIIDLSGQPSGIYLLELNGTNLHSTLKLVKSERGQ